MSSDPWEAWPEYRHVPPAMARTQAAIEALLEGRPVAPPPTAAEAAEERDERGNTKTMRRYMAQIYTAARERNRVELVGVLAEAESKLSPEDFDRVWSVGKSAARKAGWSLP